MFLAQNHVKELTFTSVCSKYVRVQKICFGRRVKLFHIWHLSNKLS